MDICNLYVDGSCQVIQRKISDEETIINGLRGYQCDLKNGLCGWCPVSKIDLSDLVKNTKQEISSEEEEVIRLHVFEILKYLGREDVSKSIEKSIPEMDKDGVDNFNKVKDYIYTLVDVVRLSR